MSDIPEGLKYSREHEWVRVEGDAAILGITDYAQSHLGDVVYVELPEVGVKLKQNGALGVVESVKAASDVYAPVSGEVLERNAKVIESPELVNRAPYGEGWLLRVKLADPAELPSLLDAAGYRDHTADG
ncbi:MAG: glycine cleavage system protein GcvH [Chloroflexi bacterium]|nr:glycine cleavage system protein GcvH [Chloroflexota bacterium]